MAEISDTDATLKRLCVFLARIYTEQNAFNWLKLNGEDEWVGADVNICDGHYSVQDNSVKRGTFQLIQCFSIPDR